MLMFDIPFGTTEWDGVERTEHPGETGKAFWRTRNFNNIRVRMVEYTPGYLADHWCQKGHVLLVLEGDGRVQPFVGGYSDWARWRDARDAKRAPDRGAARYGTSVDDRTHSTPSAISLCALHVPAAALPPWRPRGRAARGTRRSSSPCPSQRRRHRRRGSRCRSTPARAARR